MSGNPSSRRWDNSCPRKWSFSLEEEPRRYSPECSFVFGTAWWPRSTAQELTRRWRSLQSRHWFPRGSRAGSLPRWSDRVGNDRRSINLEERRRRGSFYGNTTLPADLIKTNERHIVRSSDLEHDKGIGIGHSRDRQLKTLISETCREQICWNNDNSLIHTCSQARGNISTRFWISKIQNEALFILHIQ